MGLAALGCRGRLYGALPSPFDASSIAESRDSATRYPDLVASEREIVTIGDAE